MAKKKKVSLTCPYCLSIWTVEHDFAVHLYSVHLDHVVSADIRDRDEIPSRVVRITEELAGYRRKNGV